MKFVFKISKDQKKSLIPLAAVLLLFGFIWIAPQKPIIQPWSEAVLMVDSSVKIKDPVQREILLNKSGNHLKELIEQYPFHARIHFFYGHYWLKKKQWDSSIVYLKNAIKMDSGGESNQVWVDAMDEIVFPFYQKYLTAFSDNPDKAHWKLLEAFRYNPNKKELNLLLGNVYKAKKEYDSAIYYYRRYLKVSKDDLNILNDVGVLYMLKNDLEPAQKIFEHILQLKPDHKSAKINLEFIANTKKQKNGL